jgi:hypothetical protein
MIDSFLINEVREVEREGGKEEREDKAKPKRKGKKGIKEREEKRSGFS